MDGNYGHKIIMSEKYKVKSLAKAMNVLECFTTDSPELGITQISQMLEIGKSNVHDIVTTFVQLGYLDQTENGKYKLGLKMLRYSFMVNESMAYMRAVYDILSTTSQKTGEIVYFGVPYGDQVMYLSSVHPITRLQVMPYREMAGETAPLYCTGIGKAILSFFPEKEWDQYIMKERKAFTSATITDYEMIIEDLKRCKKRGYAIDDGEREPGIRCVGVPVFNYYGKLVAGISTSGSMETVTHKKVGEFAKILQESSFQMRERLY